jgi:hypothetical protein
MPSRIQAVSAVALLALCLPTLMHLWHVWRSDSYADYGLLVSAFSAFLGWRDRDRLHRAPGESVVFSKRTTSVRGGNSSTRFVTLQ